MNRRDIYTVAATGKRKRTTLRAGTAARPPAAKNVRRPSGRKHETPPPSPAGVSVDKR